MGSRFRYFVEGPCEEKLIKSFMYQPGSHFLEGRVEVRNLINAKMTKAFARTIERDTKIIIVVDTDVENTSLLDENINVLIDVSHVKREDIYLVLSVNNFEEEMLRSCDSISSIHQLFSTKGINEFKNKFINHKNLEKKLLNAGFDIDKIWVSKPSNSFSKYNNDGTKIKIRHS